MQNILLVTDVNLSVRTNGAINSLKNYLDYVPDIFNVTITNNEGYKFKSDNVKVLQVGEKRKISLIRKTFLSTCFSLIKANKDIIKIVRTWNSSAPIIMCTSTCNIYVKYCKGSNISLILTDLPSIAYKRYFKEAPISLRKIYYAKEYIYSILYEKKLLSNYKNIILVNEDEVKYANEKYNTKKFVCVPVVYKKPNKICKIKEKNEYVDLVFIGNMSFKPNEDGILYFYNKIFRKLGDRYRLHLIGKGSDRYFHDDLRVKNYGFVEDFAEIVPNMDFGICFMKNGGGMKNKIFDYMKYGIPCIVNGYVFQNNCIESDFIFLADDIAQFENIIDNYVKEPDAVKKSIEKYEIEAVANDFWNLFA